MISKELLSEVLGYPFCSIVEIRVSSDEKSLLYTTYKAPRSVGKWKQINIYELAHKCKEWAVKDDNSFMFSKLIEFGKYREYQVFYKNGDILGEFTADTEPEAIFKACEWILEQKGR